MKWLTKSDYIQRYLTHPAFLWLSKHAKDKLPEFDEIAQYRADEGNAVELEARKLFPGGKLVQAEIFDMADRTNAIIQESPKGELTLFQGAVLTERRLYAASDVWKRNEDGSWDVYEVKSSTKVRFKDIADLCFQRVAMEEAGYKVGRLFLMHINSHYVRQGEIDPNQLLVIEDVTEQVEQNMGATRRGIEAALKVVASTECPPDGPEFATNIGAWMQIYKHLHPDVEEDSIYKLCRLNSQLVRELVQGRITRLADIVPTIELNSYQKVQVEAARIGKPLVKPEKIRRELAKLKFPLYFLDYETAGGAVPIWDGARPHQQVPFQYSLHVLEAPDGELVQREYLHRGSDDPVPNLLSHLHADLGPEGSVLVWYRDFESGCNDYMSSRVPEYAEFLRGVNARIFDLMEIFSKHLYVDAKFYGSASIKNVLPVVVPEMSYKTLGIQEGQTASLRWMQVAKGVVGEDAAQKVYDDLVTYCGQDTLAMVRIYEFLVGLVGPPAEQLTLI